MIPTSTLRALPKVELHCHLEGSVRPETLIDLGRRHDVPLPSSDPHIIYRHADLTEFLAIYESVCAAIVTVEDFARVTYEALEDAAGAGVVHREMFWNPTLHQGDYRDQLDGIIEGVRAARTDLGITTGLIPSIYRNQPVSTALELVGRIIDHRCDEVVGVGMDGDELSDPPERFAEVYERVGDAGLHRTAHVAHDGPPSFIRTCLDMLGCERVDHGYHVVDDPRLMAELAAARVPFLCATGTPPICGWSASLDDSPIRRMIEAGLTVVINSDDPAMFGSDLADEYVKVCRGWQLDPGTVRGLVWNAVDAAWVDGPERTALVDRVRRGLDRLLPEPSEVET